MLAPLRVSMLACAACASGLALVWLGLSRPESLIERSYSTAFDRQEAPRQHTHRTNAAAFDPAHLHLSQLPGLSPLGPSLAVGDRITLAQRAGEAVSFEVIDVRPLAATADGVAGDAPRLLIVTAVAAGTLPVQTLRFVIEPRASNNPAVSVQPHAL